MRTANNVGQPVGGVGPSLASQGFVDSSGKPGIVPLDPRIEGIENVAFNDFTIGVDTTGAVQGQQYLSMVRQFLQGNRQAHAEIRREACTSIRSTSIPTPSTTARSSSRAPKPAPISPTSCSASPAATIRPIRALSICAITTPECSRRTRWQIARKLTLNYGLRWDLLPPWSEKYNQMQTLIPGEQSVVYPGAPAGLLFPGDPGIPNTLAPASHTNFAPRAGVAYSPDTKTSIRASYGVFYTAIEGLSAGIMSANPPYGYSYDSVAPPLFATPFVTASSGQNIGQPSPSRSPRLAPRRQTPTPRSRLVAVPADHRRAVVLPRQRHAL
jgi:hypothetical protein